MYFAALCLHATPDLEGGIQYKRGASLAIAVIVIPKPFVFVRNVHHIIKGMALVISLSLVLYPIEPLFCRAETRSTFDEAIRYDLLDDVVAIGTVDI